jgi:hypothetical protein
MKVSLSSASAVFLIFVLSERPAHADQAWENADVVCSSRAEVALVRFGMSWNDDPPQYAKLPRDIDAGLSAAPPSKHQSCQLPSGRTVRVRIGGPPPQAHGVGGGSPQSYFDLWVGKRRVQTKQQWKPHAAFEGQEPWVSAVVVKGRSLLTCTRPGDEEETTCGRPEPQ